MSGRTVRRGGSRVGRRGRGSTGRAPAWLLPLTAAVGLIAVGIAAVLLVSSADDRSGSSPRTGAGGPGASRPAAGEASTLPVAGRSSDQVWRSVLDGLGTARGRAFQDADEAELLEVYEQGSAVYVADVALMRDMVGRGAHVSALTTRILDLQVREDRPDRAVLRVTEQLDAYDFLDAHGAVLAHQPAKAPERRDVTLVRTASGWRVAGRTPVTGG
jgi:hypothetical protein